MGSVYILYSPSLKKHYIGSCVDIAERLRKHLDKTFADGFTAKADDWILILEIADLGKHQIRKIEMHIKRMKSRSYIENLIRYPEMINRLKERYQ